MSRPTDTERGARLAMQISAERLKQPELFGDTLPPAEWGGINLAATLQYLDCLRLREVMARA